MNLIKFLILGFMMLLPLGVSRACPATHPLADSVIILPDDYNERIDLHTDRYLYAVGETINFMATTFLTPGHPPAGTSKVLYLELMSPDGSSLARAKYPFTSSTSTGSFSIPANLLTGHFYLAAYTKWMRNFSPVNFTYKHIKIINPFTPEIESSSFAILDTNPGGNQPSNTKNPLNTEAHRYAIRCSTDKNDYHPDERVVLEVSIPGDSLGSIHSLSIAVAHPASMDTLEDGTATPVSVDWDQDNNLVYMPEIRGLSVSGRILSGATPVRNAMVQLSVLGDQAKFRVNRSRMDGSFVLALDSLVGDHDFYLTAKRVQYPSLEILLDNDFASPDVEFRKLPFALTPSERQAATGIVFNMQVENIFGSPPQSSGPSFIEEPDPFYGVPTSSILIEDFIDLPTLEEVFFELIPEVFPIRKKKRPHLLFKGNEANKNILQAIDPLILIDQVPVTDLEQLFSLSPDKIRQIDVVNEIYMMGEVPFGGIVSMQSVNGDMAGIDLPEHSFFYNFRGYRPMQNAIEQDFKQGSSNENIVDFKNTLYWQSIPGPLPGEILERQFHTSELPGEFMVLVRGITLEGKVITGKCHFQVLAE